MITEVVSYKCTDGKAFSSLRDAQYHEGAAHKKVLMAFLEHNLRNATCFRIADLEELINDKGDTLAELIISYRNSHNISKR